MNWGVQETTGGVTSEITGTLYKVSKGSYGKSLPGAEFKLQKYVNGDYEDVGVTYTTDENGKLVIQWQKSDDSAAYVQYEHNVLYRVVETAAPEGYLLPASPESNAFYFYFSSDTDTTNTLPNDLPANAADLSMASRTVYVENESTNTEITVRKRWLDANGNSTTHTGSIRVKLWQIASAQTTGSATLSGELKGYNVWGTYDWKTIESKEYPAGTTISFTLTKNIWVSGAPEIKVNGQVCDAVVTDVDNNNKNYTYTFTLSGGENTISGRLPTNYNQMDSEYILSDITAQEPENSGGGDAATTTPTLYGEYDVTAADNWSLTISGLPVKGTDEAGNTFYYIYYVEEVSDDPNYEVSYANNAGVASGTITVTNQAQDSPSYELPATGGIGTHWFTLSGTAAMSIAALAGCIQRRKRKREVT